MSDNPMLGAKLIITFDKQAASDTKKALEEAKKQADALNKANLNSADAAARQAKAELEAAKATQKAAEAAKAKAAATKTVADVLKDIERQKALDNLAAKWAKVARQTKDAAAAQKGLQKELEAMNATQGEIQGAAGAFAEGGGGKNKLARVGSELRALPSTQIPGLGIGTDAIGNFLRLGGALGSLAEKSSLVLTVASALTPVLGTTAAGVAAITGVGLAALAPFALLALAIKSVSDAAAKESEVVKAIMAANKEAATKIVDGATTDDLEKEIERIKKLRQIEIDNIATNNRVFEENFKTDGFVNTHATLVKTLDDDLVASSAASTTAIVGFDTEMQALQAQIDNGATAANDAAEAEKKLAEERTKAVLNSAAAAGQEVAARTRADKATFEQNESRLTAIEDEKAAIEAQLAVLTASGDTSEEVTSEIEKLNGSLNALGKESAYISDTALAASKARDAEKKAIKDREKALEDAERKQEQADQKRLAAGQKYSEALIDIATKAADAAEDALRGLEDKLASNELSFGRDIEKLTLDADRDRLEAEIKAQSEEAADLREHQRKLESIRDDALKDEDDALKKRDFLGAARIREAANRELEAENQAFEEQQGEREIAEGEARAREDRELQAARDDRLRALQQQNADARLAYDLRLRDDEIAQDRQRRDAGINRDREIEQANVLANEVLKIKQLQGQTEIELAARTLQGIAQLGASFVPPQMNFAGGAGGNTTNNQNINSLGQLNMPIQTVIAPEMLQTIIMSTIDQIGLMPN